ncbi:MAG: hypothetical protein ACLP8B_26690 [Xanthobacteraceae bacterium]
MASKVDKLRDLTTKPATPSHQEEFDKQTGDKADDRSRPMADARQIQ